MVDCNGYSPSVVRTGACYICGSQRRDDMIRHEVYHGGNRQKSKYLGLWVNLCTACHHEVHYGHKGYDRMLKQKIQPIAMKYHGWSKEDFIRIIGKNYMEE